MTHAQETDMETDVIEAHKKGGWSQRRFQRLRDGAIEHFLKDVEARLEEIASKDEPKYILAHGPKDALNIVESRLPKHLISRWRIVEDLKDDAPENTLMHRAFDICHEEEDEVAHRLVNRLRADILTHHPSSYGFEDVQRSLLEGRGEVLLIKDDLKKPGMKCEFCEMVMFPSSSVCSICKKPTHAVDISEELLELAERTGTAIEFISNDSYLSALGGIGLLHRF